MVENTKTFKSVHRIDLTSKENQIVQLIVFKLGDEEFGAKIDQVREIIRVGSITPVPESPRFIKGVINVRGEITVAVDLKERFLLGGNKESDEKHIVITEQENSLYGLIVDEVIEVLRIPEEEIKTAPDVVKKESRTQISSVITIENRLIIMLDLNKLLSDKEFGNITEIANSIKEQQKIQPRKTPAAGNAENKPQKTQKKKKHV